MITSKLTNATIALSITCAFPKLARSLTHSLAPTRPYLCWNCLRLHKHDKRNPNFLLYENCGPEFEPGSSPGTWTRCSIWYIIWNVCIFMRYLDEILWWFIIGGFLPQRCIWHPPVWLGLSRKVVSMHLALRVNAFGFTANTRVNASHAQNLLIHFCTVSSGDVYSSSHWSEIDFQTSQSLTHKTVLTNSDRKTGTNTQKIKSSNGRLWGCQTGAKSEHPKVVQNSSFEWVVEWLR